MKWHYWLLLLALASGSSRSEQVAVVVSEVWPNATEADGSGFYWDIIRQAFASQNITLITDSAPYPRAVHQVQQWQADAWVGAYVNETDKAIYSRQAIDQDDIVVIQPIGARIDLQNGYFSWMRGYEFQRYIDIGKPGYLVSDRRRALHMLRRGRGLSGHIDVLSVLEPLQQQGELDLTDLEIRPLTTLPLHLGFQMSPRGKMLRDAFDNGMQTLQHSGELERLRHQYDW
ncbi:hypothetical protein CHH28_17930 [Bacterioplanes sanyensis]|uniref:Solute-binding protein family 3/N-terminal domain-containing protein n=1 Tax=Bacterioplanes sanyensis TaxID=1249553 RepID=A0A222FNT4_9GAMM|nr:hypothetical protein [Bacterioplanes sanyensis]ASP40439.1 hypothetical protein CHH28_17930 [Bacterioplanes sanyensis]